MKPTPRIAALICLFAFAFASIAAFANPTSAPPANQMVFEGVGTGTFNAKTMQFGFSVRCYGANCVGALVLGGPSAVTYVTGTVTQLQQDSYMLSLSATPTANGTLPPTQLPPSISCSLANTPPITQGETNAVTMTCSSPAGSGISNDAVVEVLAPTNGK
jgi:hypothetical protein